MTFSYTLDARAEFYYRSLAPDQEPDPDRIEGAISDAKTRIKNWSYEQDAHGYCRDRTDWIALVAEIERLRAAVAPEDGWRALIRQQMRELAAKDDLIKTLEEASAQPQPDTPYTDLQASFNRVCRERDKALRKIQQLAEITPTFAEPRDPDWYIAQQAADKAFHQMGEQ